MTLKRAHSELILQVGDALEIHRLLPPGKMEGKGRGVEGGVTFLLLTFLAASKN
jgi:hypothetical protein